MVEGLLSNDLLEKRQVAQTRQDTQGTSKVAVERRGGVKANAYQSAEGDSVLTSRLDSTSTITRGNVSPFRKTKKATPAVSPPPRIVVATRRQTLLYPSKKKRYPLLGSSASRTLLFLPSPRHLLRTKMSMHALSTGLFHHILCLSWQMMWTSWWWIKRQC